MFLKYSNTALKQLIKFNSIRNYSPLNYRPKGRKLPGLPRYNQSENYQQQEQPEQQYYNSEPTSDGTGSTANYSFSPSYKESPHTVISSSHSCFPILSQPTLVIERRIEYMNLFLGFEQANKYALYDAMGTQIGWLIERDYGIGKMIMRQIYRLHRPFTVDLLNMEGELLLTIKRPFSFINSHIKAILPIEIDSDSKELENASDIEKEGIVAGESIQSWHLWRRRYNLFESVNDGKGSFEQFGKIDSGFLRWEFPVFDQNNLVCGSVTRNFNGLFREAFTDTGVYVLRMDPSSFVNGECEFGEISNYSLTLDQKAVMLANAISIDFDYFSRHSGVGGGGLLVFGDSD